MSETPQERAQAWCEEHAEHKSVPGTKFVSGRLLCSRDDVVKLLQPLEAEVERLRELAAASEADVERLKLSMLAHFNEEHLAGDGPEIDRWKAGADHFEDCPALRHAEW